ncbi:hypothetical protein C8F04DRAFT_581313 [Mycena alexandri]|uniref:Uncharacterized protein n=1 Tax=Mycena alexandri TaxID=1745969 RepID=A0AAD6RVM7_9AGAR|nr:hypothetical protein C8F04DRAFT_581313 [Mycena alexandri]
MRFIVGLKAASGYFTPWCAQHIHARRRPHPPSAASFSPCAPRPERSHRHTPPDDAFPSSRALLPSSLPIARLPISSLPSNSLSPLPRRHPPLPLFRFPHRYHVGALILAGEHTLILTNLAYCTHAFRSSKMPPVESFPVACARTGRSCRSGQSPKSCSAPVMHFSISLLGLAGSDHTEVRRPVPPLVFRISSLYLLHSARLQASSVTRP